MGWCLKSVTLMPRTASPMPTFGRQAGGWEMGGGRHQTRPAMGYEAPPPPTPPLVQLPLLLQPLAALQPSAAAAAAAAAGCAGCEGPCQAVSPARAA